ncbi:MAG: hypothetical protein MJY85_00045 [Fibrobacter sp.]|nr:hypothetical protein [Fibrobacter sp.]
MNFEKVNELSKKIEGVLGTVRALKEENASLKQQLSASQADAQDKTLLLERANANLAECQAALNDQEITTKSQTQSLNTKDLEIEDLKEQLAEKDKESENLKDQIFLLENETKAKDEKLQQCAGLLQESADRIKEYEAKCIESADALQASQAQVQEGEAKAQEQGAQIEELNKQVSVLEEKRNEMLASVANYIEEIGALKSDIDEKNGLIDSLNSQLQVQADEIAEAQERFNQLVATIETELGTDLTLEQGEATDVQEETLDELEEDLVEDVPEEPVVESSEEEVAQEETPEEDIPVIEVHPAEEKKEDNDLFSSASNGGSQTNFFG